MVKPIPLPDGSPPYRIPPMPPYKPAKPETHIPVAIDDLRILVSYCETANWPDTQVCHAIRRMWAEVIKQYHP